MILLSFLSFQSREHKITQLESDVKDYEEQITNLKAQAFQEQQKLFDRESEWKENMAKQDTHAKALKIEVRRELLFCSSHYSNKKAFVVITIVLVSIRLLLFFVLRLTL